MRMPDYLLIILRTLVLTYAFMSHLSFPACMLLRDAVPDNSTIDAVIPIPTGNNTN